MPTITITITDQPYGRAAIASTNGERPALGRALSPAQALAMDLLRTCERQAQEVRYGAEHVPLVQLATRLLHPEDLGFAATPQMRDAARQALGLPATETIRRVRAAA